MGRDTRKILLLPFRAELSLLAESVQIQILLGPVPASRKLAHALHKRRLLQLDLEVHRSFGPVIIHRLLKRLEPEHLDSYGPIPGGKRWECVMAVGIGNRRTFVPALCGGNSRAGDRLAAGLYKSALGKSGRCKQE